MPLRKNRVRPLVVKASTAVAIATVGVAAGASSASASASSLTALLAQLGQTSAVPVVVPKVPAPVVAVPVVTAKATPTPTPTPKPNATPAPAKSSGSNLFTTAASTVTGAGTALASGLTTAASTITSVATGAAESATTACPVQPATQAFAKLGDSAEYSLAPGGNFESGSAGWTLTGGATIASGNETTGVTTGSKSLQLPAGAVAISPQFCVDDTNPYFRFVARNDGQLSGYEAIVLYRDAAGMLKQAQFTSSSDSSVLPGNWGASDISPLATKIPLLSSAPTASVQLMFVATRITNLGSLLPGQFGTVSIDSVMVDPYRRG